MSWKVDVKEEACVGCGACIDVCPVEVFALQQAKAVPANQDDCLGCESCIGVCGLEAITVEEA